MSCMTLSWRGWLEAVRLPGRMVRTVRERHGKIFEGGWKQSDRQGGWCELSVSGMAKIDGSGGSRNTPQNHPQNHPPKHPQNCPSRDPRIPGSRARARAGFPGGAEIRDFGRFCQNCQISPNFAKIAFREEIGQIGHFGGSPRGPIGDPKSTPKLPLPGPPRLGIYGPSAAVLIGFLGVWICLESTWNRDPIHPPHHPQIHPRHHPRIRPPRGPPRDPRNHPQIRSPRDPQKCHISLGI